MANGFYSSYLSDQSKEEKEAQEALEKNQEKRSMNKTLKFEVIMNRKDKDLMEILEDIITDPDSGVIKIKVTGDFVRIKTMTTVADMEGIF